MYFSQAEQIVSNLSNLVIAVPKHIPEVSRLEAPDKRAWRRSRSIRPSQFNKLHGIAIARHKQHFAIWKNPADCERSLDTIDLCQRIAHHKRESLRFSEFDRLLPGVRCLRTEAGDVKSQRQTIRCSLIFVNHKNSRFDLALRMRTP